MGLELANSRAEVLALSEGLESWTRGVEAFEWQIVATPADFNTPLLQGNKDDQGGSSNGTRKRGGGNAKMKSIQTQVTLAFGSDTH